MTDIELKLREAALDLPADAPSLAERADDEGLLDVAYASVESPLGPLLVAATPEGLARRVSPRVLEAPAKLDRVRRELDEYFDGRRQDFDLAIDWSHLAGFTREVLRATAQIPFGDVSTYAGVAEAAGSPRPVGAGGDALGGYTGGLERKEFLLRLEGKLL